MKNKILKTITGILFAIIFLFLALKGQPFDEILKTVLAAKGSYILLAVVFYFLSYIARSEKWRIQVKNLNYKLEAKPAFYALMLHFFVNSFTIKLGGFIRCANLKKTANVPFPACFASYLSECIFDFIFMSLAIFIVLIYQFNDISKILLKLFNDLGISQLFNHPISILIWSFFIIVILFAILYLYKKKKILKKHKSKLQEFIVSLKKTFNLKKYGFFILWNIILWLMLYFMNYFLFISLFENIVSVKLIFTITAFSYAAWLMPNPGGIGSVEYFVLQAFLLFGLSKTSALSFGILSNGFTLISTLIFGFILILLQSVFELFNQKNINTPKKS